jgi:hypothetical protein
VQGVERGRDQTFHTFNHGPSFIGDGEIQGTISWETITLQ